MYRQKRWLWDFGRNWLNTASLGNIRKQDIHSTLLSHGSLTVWPKRGFVQRGNCHGASSIILDTLLPSFCWLILLVTLLLDITPLILENVLLASAPTTPQESLLNVSPAEHKGKQCSSEARWGSAEIVALLHIEKQGHVSLQRVFSQTFPPFLPYSPVI